MAALEEMTTEDLATDICAIQILVGDALLHWMHASRFARHARPKETLAYVHPFPGDTPEQRARQQLGRDVVTWFADQPCPERLANLIDRWHSLSMEFDARREPV